VIYEVSPDDQHPHSMYYKVKAKFNKKTDCFLLILCSNHLILCLVSFIRRTLGVLIALFVYLCYYVICVYNLGLLSVFVVLSFPLHCIRPSFSCEFLVRVSWTENLGRLSWALDR